MSRFVAMLNARILMPLYRLLFPILWLADTAISTMLRKLKAEGRDHLSKVMSTLSEDDFMLLMEEGHREGTVDPRERKLITNVFEFDDSTVSEVMTPINQAFCVAATDKVGDVLPEIRLQKYSRIPVVQKGRKNVLGILYVKDLLQLKNHPKLGEIEVRTLMAPPMIVGSNVHLSVLFRRFKEAKSHMAVVVVREPSPAVPATSAAGIREGEVLGIVTMDDVLESIFGAIPDERDVR
jgi:putative hemolysin